MPDAIELVKTIKKAAVDAVDAAKPADVQIGYVLSATPLEIKLGEKLILKKAQLILSRNVTDYTTKITVDWSSDKASPDHDHTIKGKKDITIHNSLVAGEEVILIRKYGGQKYVVWDRVIT